MTNAGYLVNGEAFTPAFGVPRLGEHSREILDELGYNADKIERLVETNAVGTLDES